MSDRYIVCHLCRSSILSERFEKHFFDNHQEDVDELKAESASEQTLQARSISEKRGPNLDATKNMCYPARDHGSYGSHASYDGFDDESES